MNTRNLILVALALTSVMVFTQLGAIAGAQSDNQPCNIVPNGLCPACVGGIGQTCHAGGTTCEASGYMDCCNWAMTQVRNGHCSVIYDHTDCGMCCGA